MSRPRPRASYVEQHDEYRNMTPHVVRVYSDDLWPVHMPTLSPVCPERARLVPPHELYQPPYWEIAPDPAGPARVAVTEQPAGHHVGIPLSTPSYGEVTGLPEPARGVLLIVSLLVQQACPERKDLVIPSGLTRGDDGQPIGCRSLGLRPPSEKATSAVQTGRLSRGVAS